MIDHGKLAVDDAVENVKKKYGTKETVEIEVEGDLNSPEDFRLPFRAACEMEGNLIRCSYDRKEMNAAAVIQAVMERYKIMDVKVKEADIDDVVEEIYKEGAEIEKCAR